MEDNTIKQQLPAEHLLLSRIEQNLDTPKAIKATLDDYVIGQEQAKKTLSVAVYSHYRRLLSKKEQEERFLAGLRTGGTGNRSVPDFENSEGKKTPMGSQKTEGVQKINESVIVADPTTEIEKSNVLLIGPTGSGKTLLASTLAKIMQVPFAIADATTLTEAGYVGDDVENILLRLIQNADYQIRVAEKGIIFIDEIDKIGRKSENASITRDVSGEGVQQALLKIIEGAVVKVPVQGGRKHPQGQTIDIDTKDILFICGGAFVGLEDIVSNRLGTRAIGFHLEKTDANKKTGTDKHANENANGDANDFAAKESIKQSPKDSPPASSKELSEKLPGESPDESNSESPGESPNEATKKSDREHALTQAVPDDLMRFGIIPELVGRLPILTPLMSLSKKELMRILIEPKNALLKQYALQLDLEGIKLQMDKSAYDYVIDEAMKLKMGARGLRSVMERIMQQVFFLAPEKKGKTVVLSAATIKNGDFFR